MPKTDITTSLLMRFGGATPEMLARVLAPYRLQLTSIQIKANRKGATFHALLPSDVWTTLEEGTTGKIVPREHVEKGAPWREVIKARVRGEENGKIRGELYFEPPSRLEPSGAGVTGRSRWRLFRNRPFWGYVKNRICSLRGRLLHNVSKCGLFGNPNARKRCHACGYSELL